MLQMVWSGPEEGEWWGEIFNNDFINTMPTMTSTAGFTAWFHLQDLIHEHSIFTI